jgi:hypothetical protein
MQSRCSVTSTQVGRRDQGELALGQNVVSGQRVQFHGSPQAECRIGHIEHMFMAARRNFSVNGSLLGTISEKL